MIQSICVKGRPDEKNKRCYDCYYCQAAQSWWCMNNEAADYKGTARIGGGVRGCHFWKPVRVKADMSWWERVCLWFNIFIFEIECDGEEYVNP